MVMILIFMFPSGGGRPPTENTDEDLMIDGYAQIGGHITAAQVALADRDAIIAAQSEQTGMLSQQMAALNLRAHRAQAAAAGPARSAALRGAAASASPSVGGAYATPSVAMAAAVALSARRAARATDGGFMTVATALTAALLANTASAAAAERVEVLPLPLNVERCLLPGCVDHPVGSTAFMTKAGKKWHTTRLCTAVRGRETVEHSLQF